MGSMGASYYSFTYFNFLILYNMKEDIKDGLKLTLLLIVLGFFGCVVVYWGILVLLYIWSLAQ